MNRVLGSALSFASVVLFALLAARLVAEDRRYALLVVALVAAIVVPAALSRRKMQKLLLSGDVAQILGTWQGTLRRVGHPETMAPLMTATAYAAYGFIDAARMSLSRAARGPAWEAAIEQRLFVEALLDVYEGDRARALAKAAELERLPLPSTGFWVRRKIALLRRGTAALARAFAHESRAEDERLLSRVARSSPLVHWAMRYARAVVLVDKGRSAEALALIAAAPSWPEDSAFHAFHEELLGAVRSASPTPATA